MHVLILFLFKLSANTVHVATISTAAQHCRCTPKLVCIILEIVVIPNLVELKKNPDNSILIFFVKSSNNNIIKQRIQAVKKIQEVDKNIWVISKDEINISQRVYIIEKESFSRFLDDIQNFTELKNMNKLNIFKSKI